MKREDMSERLRRGVIPATEEEAARGESPRLHVSVVCPFYNEEEIIAAAAARMSEKLGAQFDSWELILVDDGSEDSSLAALRDWIEKERDSRITVLSYPGNRGRGRALKTGIDAARGDVIVTTEVDCSWGDDIVSRLVREIEARGDIQFVVASPHREGGGFVAVPWSRCFISRFGNALVSLFFKSRLTMHTGMTRAYRREIVQPLRVREEGKEFHLEVLLKLLTLGFRAVEIPATIDWSFRLKRQGRARPGRTLLKLYPTILTHLAFVAVVQPMRYFGLLSAVTVLGAVFFLSLAVRNYLTGGIAIYYAITGLFMALFSLLFIGFSVVFTQLRNISRESWMRDYAEPANLTVVPGTTVFRAGVQ